MSNTAYYTNWIERLRQGKDLLKEEDCGDDNNFQVRERDSKDVGGKLECMCVRETEVMVVMMQFGVRLREESF